MFDAASYSARRRALIDGFRRIEPEVPALLFIGNRESPMNYRDNCYPFRQDSSFLYFFGLSDPDLAALIDLSSGEATVFGDEATLDDIVWTGPLPSLADRAAAVGVFRIAPRAALGAAVAAVRKAAAALPAYLPPYRAETRAELAELLGISPAAAEASASIPLIKAVVALREIKDADEVAELEKAAAASVEMHRRALSYARPGLRERDLAAELSRAAAADGGRLSFPVIAAVDGSVLHSRSSAGVLAPGGLCLVDAGAETAAGYAGDLTTTFPVSSRFSDRQKDVYRIVLDAHRAACSLIRPGRPYREVHLGAARAVAEGLRSLGILRGDVDDAVDAGAHALFFPHGVGHQIGLDVHDMESLGERWVGYDGGERSSQFGLKSLRMAKPLCAGMAVTVEPGVYFIGPLIDRWREEGRCAEFIDYRAVEAYRGFGGVRNEEDWLVTDDGGRRLGPAFDKSPGAIEALRGASSGL
jgi:Xaa-Pro aminopeptidase